MRCLYLLLTTLLVNSMALQAQNSEYDFSSFKLPDIRYQGLDLDLNLNGNHNDLGASSPGLENSSIQSFAHANYFQFRNLQGLQAEQSLSLGLTHRYRHSENFFIGGPNQNLKYTTFNSSLQYRSSKRFYDPDQKFLSYEINTLVDYSFSKDHIDDQNSDFIRFDISIPLTKGKGRVEPIGDVQMAWFMTMDMYDLGLLNQKLDNEALMSLAGEMAKSRYTRLFDFRTKKKNELSRIDSLINQLNIVNNFGIEYYTTLADNWIYNYRNQRQAGKRFSYGLQPGVYYQYNKFSGNGKSSLTYANVAALIQYERFKPLNPQWQLDYDLLLSLGYGKVLGDYTEDDPSMFIIETGASLSASYYPNSRTRFYSGLNIDLGLQDYNNTGEFDVLFRADLNAGTSYYLSPRTRLNIEAGWIYTEMNNDSNQPVFFPSVYSLIGSTDRFITNFRISLDHSIF